MSDERVSETGDLVQTRSVGDDDPRTVVRRRHAAGESMKAIAADLGLARERVRQLVKADHVVSVQVAGEEVWEHRSTGARTDAAAAEFALRSWVLGRDLRSLGSKTVSAVVVGGLADREAS